MSFYEKTKLKSDNAVLAWALQEKLKQHSDPAVITAEKQEETGIECPKHGTQSSIRIDTGHGYSHRKRMKICMNCAVEMLMKSTCENGVYIEVVEED